MFFTPKKYTIMFVYHVCVQYTIHITQAFLCLTDLVQPSYHICQSSDSLHSQFELIVIKILPKILHIRPLEELEPLNSVTPMPEGPLFSVGATSAKAVAAAEKCLQEQVLRLEDKIRDMKSSEWEDLVNEHKIMKWKYAANVMNSFFFVVSVLYALGIYIKFYVDSAATTNSQYTIPEY